ncbi:hypothetical protein RJT34_12010 [Clitoria ternatea]|uniref:ENTH domain-containing protein n=1 Tax=Clitoria ternatea TaxID=43366 RepID=A0AAN9JPL4_CLITE
MHLRKRLRNLLHSLKDKASVIAASLSNNRHVSSVRIHVVRATTHSFYAPPSEAKISAVLSAGRGSYLLPRACIDALMDRLHKTQNATVALKCLFTIHNIIAKGPLTLKDNLSHYPSHGGNNNLNLSAFRDNTDTETLELSSWVRWYANILEHVLTVSRAVGYYLSSSKGEFLGARGDLLREIRVLVDFVEHVSHVPESLHLQRNDLVYEVVRLVREDYGNVQREILWRVEEVGKRVEGLDVVELRQLVGCLGRMEECKERLVLLFVNRKRNDVFWDLIGGVKRKGVAMVEEMEGNWVTVVTAKNESADLTRYVNPFLDSPGGAWPRGDEDLFRLTVSTVGF